MSVGQEEILALVNARIKKSLSKNKFFASLPSIPCNSAGNSSVTTKSDVTENSCSTFPRNGVKRNKSRRYLDKSSKHYSHENEDDNNSDSSEASVSKFRMPTKRCKEEDNNGVAISNSNHSSKHLGLNENGKAESKRSLVPSSTVSLVRKPKLKTTRTYRRSVSRSRSKSTSPKPKRKLGVKVSHRKKSPSFSRNDKQNEKFTFFFTKKYPFSNHYPCQVELDGHVFNCTEQYYMYHKALAFKDDKAAQEILDCNNPKKMKQIGNKIKGFNQNKWNNESEKIMFIANFAKYSQNKEVRLALLATEGTTLVETNPTDQRWGIGLSMTDVRAHHRSTWRGQNLLGRILTQIRDGFIEKNSFPTDLALVKNNPKKYLWWKTTNNSSSVDI